MNFFPVCHGLHRAVFKRVNVFLNSCHGFTLLTFFFILSTFLKINTLRKWRIDINKFQRKYLKTKYQ